MRSAPVGAFSAGVKLVAMLKEVAVANYFGRSAAVDAFLVAYLLPGFVIVLAAGSLNPAFIPTFIFQVRQASGEDAAQRLFCSCMVWSQILLVGLALALGKCRPIAAARNRDWIHCRQTTAMPALVLRQCCR